MLGTTVLKTGDYLVKSRTGGHHVDEFLCEMASGKWLVIGGNVSDAVRIRQVHPLMYTHATVVRGTYSE